MCAFAPGLSVKLTASAIPFRGFVFFNNISWSDESGGVVSAV
tara:strand:- start:97 stop:222 length:126 start_codon:yes stop_codon:yes gene_type:complete